MDEKNLKLLLVLFALAIVSCSNNDKDTIQNEETTVTDIEGNRYQTVTIGNQTWMAENLKTTTFSDGSSITEYEHFNQPTFPWYDPNNPQELFQWAFTGDLNNIYPEKLLFDFYGAHYNYQAIQSGKLEIDGWRLPTQQDFNELIDYLESQGHTGNQATVLKSEIGWTASSGNGTNLYGFNVRPAGNTIIVGTPDFSELIARLSTSEINMVNNTRKVATFFGNGEIEFEDIDIRFGLSIRLIKE